MITENREIEAKDIKRLLLRVYKKYQTGAITEAQAYKETYLLNSILKFFDTSLPQVEEKVTARLISGPTPPDE
jgi:hypothetical protein